MFGDIPGNLLFPDAACLLDFVRIFSIFQHGLDMLPYIQIHHNGGFFPVWADHEVDRSEYVSNRHFSPCSSIIQRLSLLPAAAPVASRLVRLFRRGLAGRLDGHRCVQALLVGFIQQHGDDGQFVFVFGQAAGERGETPRTLGLEFVPPAQAGFEQGGHPFGHHRLHVCIAGDGALFQRDLELFADLVEGELLNPVDQRDGHAAGSGAPGPPGAVDVGLRLLGRFVQDDVRQAGDVQPARRHVGGDEEAQGPAPHTVQHPLPVRLGQVGGEFVGVVSEALEDDGHVMDARLGVAEDERRRRVFDLDQAHETAVLVHARHNVENVLGLGHVDVVGAQVDEFRFVDELARRLHDRAGEGGREHAGMDGMPGQVALEVLHVGIKAHREHPVGFIVDQHFEMFEREGAFEQVVQHPPRRSNDDVRAFFERFDLRPVAHAAIDGDCAQASLGADLFGLLPDLARQFARRDEDQRLAGRFCRVEPRQHGQQERAGLAASSAGLDHHIAPGQQVGDGARLHRHERVPAGARRGLA
jgi:hypothetical protein